MSARGRRGELPKVWDGVVRSVHWGLVVAFSVAYLTEDDALGVHVWAGYAVGALLIVRLVWASWYCSCALRELHSLAAGGACRFARAGGVQSETPHGARASGRADGACAAGGSDCLRGERGLGVCRSARRGHPGPLVEAGPPSVSVSAVSDDAKLAANENWPCMRCTRCWQTCAPCSSYFTCWPSRWSAGCSGRTSRSRCSPGKSARSRLEWLSVNPLHRACGGSPSPAERGGGPGWGVNMERRMRSEQPQILRRHCWPWSIEAVV